MGRIPKTVRDTSVATPGGKRQKGILCEYVLQAWRRNAVEHVFRERLP